MQTGTEIMRSVPVASAVTWAALVAFTAVAAANDYFVDPTGAGGAFTSIQAAVNAVPAGSAAIAQARRQTMAVPGLIGLGPM